MNFNHLPLDEFEEPISDLETAIDLRIDIFVPWHEFLSEHEDLIDQYIPQDDYLQKESEKQQEQQDLNKILQERYP
jgi:hypothetical protein